MDACLEPRQGTELDAAGDVSSITMTCFKGAALYFCG